MKHISAIGSIDAATVWFETFHTISELTVVCSRYSTMTITPLVIAINKTNSSRISIATHEISHTVTYTTNVELRGARASAGKDQSRHFGCPF